jgi:hypothetical protein
MRARGARVGDLPFLYDRSEVPEALTDKYCGPEKTDYTDV